MIKTIRPSKLRDTFTATCKNKKCEERISYERGDIILGHYPDDDLRVPDHVLCPACGSRIPHKEIPDEEYEWKKSSAFGLSQMSEF